MATTESLKADLVQTRPALDPADMPVRDLVLSMRGEFAKALPAHIPAERFARVALTELRRTPKLGQCSGASLLGALMNAAQLGLQPAGPLGHYWLTPRRVKGRWEVVGIVGYRGYILLAHRAAGVLIFADAVHEGDVFEERRGSRAELVHVPPPLDQREPNRKLLGVYAIARRPDGTDSDPAVLSLAEVQEHARRYGSPDGPWKDHFEEMAKKTAVRKLAKYLPAVSDELALADQTDERPTLYVGSGRTDVADLPADAEPASPEGDAP